MKKCIIMCMAAVALLFASCKNEDISISREVTFNVNPYSVISEFAMHEVNTGDLDIIPSDGRLRVMLLVYDAIGDLKVSNVSYSTNYHSITTCSAELEEGDYTIVAITNVVGGSEYNITKEFWYINGKEHLAELRVVNNDDEWDNQYKILGIKTTNITVGTNQTVHQINVEPVGAMVITWIMDIHHYVDAIRYSLWMNKNSNYYTINNNGTVEAEYEQIPEIGFPLQSTNPNSNDFDNIYRVYGYHFLMPFGNTDFRWQVRLDDGYDYWYLDKVSVNIKTGRIYQLDLDLVNNTFTSTELREDGEKNVVLNDGMIVNGGLSDNTKDGISLTMSNNDVL